MSLQNRTDTDPRMNFQKDIRTFLKEQLEKHTSIATTILGDWNETAHDDETTAALIKEFNLADLWDHQDQEEDFSTCNRAAGELIVLQHHQNCHPSLK